MRALESRGRVTHKARLPATPVTLTDTAPHVQRCAYAKPALSRRPPPPAAPRAAPGAARARRAGIRGPLHETERNDERAVRLTSECVAAASVWLDDDHRTRLVCLGVTRPRHACSYAEPAACRRCLLTRLASSLPCRHGSQTAAPGRARHGSSGPAATHSDV